MNAVENFHKGRIAFADIGGRLYFLKEDSRGHDQWLDDMFGIRGEAFEVIPRGYIKDGRIQLYIGSNFEVVVPQEKVDHILKEVVDLLRYEGIFGEYRVFNGVKIGDPGELWDPIEELPCVTV